MALGRPVNKDTQYKVIVHTLGKHKYASTKVFTIGEDGKKRYTYRHWGTLEDGNRFHPGTNYFYAPVADRNKLIFPSDWEKIQHVGVVDINKGPTHKLATFDDREIHYFGRNRYAWDVLAVTGACLMVDREKYFNVGGFHDKMKVGYNDVDLCVKLYENGYYNIVDCGVTLIHHESVARGYDSDSIFKIRRLRQERVPCNSWSNKC